MAGNNGAGDARQAAPPAPGDKRAEIYTYTFPHQVYSMNWTVRAALPAAEAWCTNEGLAGASPHHKSARTQLHCTTICHPLNTRLACTQVRKDKKFRLGVGSFIEDYHNRVDIISRALLLGGRAGTCGS